MQSAFLTQLQTEKAFQKQTAVFLNSKKLLAKKTTAGVRYYKKIGLGKSPGFLGLRYPF